MRQILFLIPSLPLAGALILGLLGRRMPSRLAALTGTAASGASALVALIVSCWFLLSPPATHVYAQTLWTWLVVGNFHPEISFRFDALTLVMVLVVSFVGFLIHLYSVEFMRGEEGYSRFFAYMNLFVASMLILVMARDLLLLYLGWEGVGLCSYLLIGFWYRNPDNGRAARKAFIVTRVGDTALAIGLFFLFTRLGTLDIPLLLARAPLEWKAGSTLAVATAALFLGGAVGKSAQLPLQTWLPDAMAGPTPVSALIHAATMVTAGVYLIARMHTLFELAPAVQLAVGVVGAATLLTSSLSALVQTDIKRVLAYSTISQIGYMFLALGAGAWSAAIFHFMTHAFFKALLFLAAGAVILALDHEHDILKMGGLRKRMPLVFWTFLIGAASLSALPFVTAGFYSKELILSQVYGMHAGGLWLWIAGVAGAFLTSLYSFRLVFLVFYGEERLRPSRRTGLFMAIPLMILAILSIAGGFVDLPAALWSVDPLSSFLSGVFTRAPELPPYTYPHPQAWLLGIASIASVLGIGVACWLYLIPQASPVQLPARLKAFLFSGWGFDWLYDLLWVKPFVAIAHLNRDDAVDLVFTAIARMNRGLSAVLSTFETGKLRWYAAVMGAGAIVLIVLAEVR